MKKIFLFLKKNKGLTTLSILFFLHLFLRFSSMETKNIFGWDQTNNAWVSFDMIEHHRYPLLGMIAKQDTGFYVGPLYYYFIAIFYFFTNLDPIASGIAAGFVSILTFWGLFYFIKKIFSFNVALFATFINTIAMGSITFDRAQWPVALLPLASLAILYFLYGVISGKPKYLIPLSIVVGLSFHLHFTAIFFPLFILLCLPFFPRNKETLKYALASIPLFLVWLLPNFVAELQSKNVHTGNLLAYLGGSYHGFHLRRFLQLTSDAFIQFEPFLFSAVKTLKYILIPIFFLIFLNRHTKKSIKLSLLIALWFLGPWVLFSTYRGELSEYYFSINRYLAIAVVAYLLNFIYKQKNILFKAIILFIVCFYSYFNIANFFIYHADGGLKQKRERVDKAIQELRPVEFREGAPEPYIYHIYKIKK